MASDNITETYSWLRATGFMKGTAMAQHTDQCIEANDNALREICLCPKEFTLDEMTAMSRAFDAGSYANAYETTDIDACDETDDMSAHEHAAFVLGFYSSCELHEIDDRELFDEAYFSDAGRYVVNVAGYCDDRADDYASEMGGAL